MRIRAVVLAATRHGAARRARPPTSSCGGRRATTPRRTRRSRRSSPPSSRRPASRSSWSSIQSRSFRRQDRGGARGGPAARLRLRLIGLLHRTMGLRRSARGPLRRRRPLFGPVRSGRARLGTVAQREHRAKGPVRAADGPYDLPRPRLEEPPGARGLHLSRTFRRSGRRSGPSGATRCSRRCAKATAATTSGASACRWGRVRHPERVLPVPGRLRGRIT